MSTLIRHANIVTGDSVYRGSVLFDTKIREIFLETATLPSAEEVIDAEGKMLFAGFIDPHVHFRTPGLTYKEDLSSGSQAALAGGVTMIFDMPNTIPPTLSVEIWEEKKSLMKNSAKINMRAFFGASEDNLEEIKKATVSEDYIGTKMYLNDTTGNLKMNNENIWGNIFQVAKKVAMHAEGETFSRAIEVWKSVGSPCEIHLCHMTLRQEVELIRSLKSNKNFREKISAEVCPHHLFFNEVDRETIPTLRMKPELATEDDVSALWEAIADGTIDCFASDHAPHLLKEKQSDPPAFGVPGVGTIFPMMFDAWYREKRDWKDFAQMMSERASEIYHLENFGKIRENFSADFVLVDPESRSTISAKNLYSKSNWTPFEGREVQGKIDQVFVGGYVIK